MEMEISISQWAARADFSSSRIRRLQSNLIRLNLDIRRVCFKALVGHDFLDSRAERLLIRIPGKFAMASNDLFAVYNSNQPTRLSSIPGDSCTICTHDFLRRKLHDILA